MTASGTINAASGTEAAIKFFMVRPVGFEPTAYCSGGNRSIP